MKKTILSLAVVMLLSTISFNTFAQDSKEGCDKKTTCEKKEGCDKKKEDCKKDKEDKACCDKKHDKKTKK